MVKIVSQHGFAQVELEEQSGQQALRALAPIERGDVLHDFSAVVTRGEPSYLTVQVGDSQHIMLNPSFLQYINHSCAPNVFFDTTQFKLIAIETIEVGDEITFFYPSTEWDMQQPFVCNCKAKNCLGMIRGAKYLTLKNAEQYLFSDYIQQKIYKTISKADAKHA